MTQGPSYYVNSPVSGTQYTAPAGYGCIPNNATSVTVTVKAWSGSNGTGSLVTCTTVVAIIWNNTGSVQVSSFTGSSVNTASASSSSGSNGTNILVPSGKYTGTGVGSLEMFITYTGSAVSIARSYRTNAWITGQVNVTRSSAQTLATGVFAYRTGVWVRAT